jgi:hypothetical protein
VKPRSLILLFMLGMGISAVQAQVMQLEIIPLKHRTVNEVLPVVRPLVMPGGTVTGTANQLIIKSTPDNIADIRRVLDSIDRAQRRLLITVRQDVGGSISKEEQGLSGSYSTGDVHVSGGESRGQGGGLSISSRNGDGNHVEYHVRRLDGGSDDRNTFTVQALEGSPAFIQAGGLVPVHSRNVIATPGAVVTQDTVEYHDATSGFYVLPRLNGDTVSLLVAPRLSGTGAHGAFDVQNVETTVSGRLGEWLRIGGIVQDSHSRDNGLLSESQRQSRTTRSILLKVEELH